MSFLVGRLILIGIMASLPACVIVNDFKENLKAYGGDKSEAQFPYRHSSPDINVAWDIVQKGNDTVVDGLITNIRNIQIGDLYMNVEVFDSDGKRMSMGDALSPQRHLNMKDSFAFSVILKDAKISEGNFLRFLINYRSGISSGAWGGGGNSGKSDFKVYETTGIAIEEQGGK
jgi:hypothetical protein